MSCDIVDYHGEHYYENHHGNDSWCRGKYEVIATYGPWRIVLCPSGDGSGWLETSPESGLPVYPIDSSYIHKGEPNGHTWDDQVAEKAWAQPFLVDFLTALRAAQARWPRRR